ncbi:MAG: HU family DNA-binding protein [Malacoplasma sp.]|nr:HU family DNA-binding protein [Malacoplasma sp.]
MAIEKTYKLVDEKDKKPRTKKEIIKLISNNSNIAESIIKDIFEDFVNLIKAELDRCEQFRLFDLGKIKLKPGHKKITTNPLTGETETEWTKSKIKFVFSKQYKELAETFYTTGEESKSSKND